MSLIRRIGYRDGYELRARTDGVIERVVLMEHRDRIEQWLTQKKPLRLKKVHVLLKRDHGVEVAY